MLEQLKCAPPVNQCDLCSAASMFNRSERPHPGQIGLQAARLTTLFSWKFSLALAACVRQSASWVQKEALASTAVPVVQQGAPLLLWIWHLPSPQRILDDLLESDDVCAIHCAPPCGACSLARTLRNGPKPLRDSHHPDGLPRVQGVDLQRVRSANKLYELVGRLAKLCYRKGILLCVENPARSLFWLVTAVQPCRTLPSLRVWFPQAQSHKVDAPLPRDAENECVVVGQTARRNLCHCR